MRNTSTRALPLCIVAALGTAYAQGNALLEGIEVFDPLLTVTVRASVQSGTCDAPLVELWAAPPNSFACSVWEETDTGTEVAADGSVIRWFRDYNAADPACPVYLRETLRIMVTRPNGSMTEAMRVDYNRGFACTVGDCTTRITSQGGGGGPMRVVYDVTSGVLLIDRDAYVADCVTGQILARDRGVIAISGFPTMLDLILSYQPPATLSFNVPVHPEGLPGADSFSVYTGDVRHASDLSQAAPLQCTVPSGRPPVPGEQLSVPDPLPDPAEGDARYYLAAVNYQGQRRAGRSAINGVLQGRNAAALPGCK